MTTSATALDAAGPFARSPSSLVTPSDASSTAGHTRDVRRGLLGQGLTYALACVKRDGRRWPSVFHRA
ncbi:hypothetical protein EGY19_29245 [Burkholderia multivorans]|nr:hypothetical protein EGY19_29245 [Burkholderia multivorans]PRG50386.1 hypothetical protein C6T63_18255 [Burkholderia multivorans]